MDFENPPPGGPARGVAGSGTRAARVKIAMYFSPLWAGARSPTGVGRHIAHMAGSLRAASGVSELALLASAEAYARDRTKLAAALADLPVRFLPGSEGVMRRVQLATTMLPLDRWAGGVDLDLLLREQPVAARKARLAITVHDMLASERHVRGLRRQPGIACRLWWRVIMRRILERADVIATASRFTADRIVDLFHVRDDRRISVVGNGVSPVFFRTRQPADQEILDKCESCRTSMRSASAD
jgi:hypothetical protein